MAAIIYGIGLDLEVLVLPLSAQQWRNFMMAAKQTVDRMLFSSSVAREHCIQLVSFAFCHAYSASSKGVPPTN